MPDEGVCVYACVYVCVTPLPMAEKPIEGLGSKKKQLFLKSYSLSLFMIMCICHCSYSCKIPNRYLKVNQYL